MKTICNKTSPLNWIKLVFMVNWVSISYDQNRELLQEIIYNTKGMNSDKYPPSLYIVLQNFKTLLIIQERGY